MHFNSPSLLASTSSTAFVLSGTSAAPIVSGSMRKSGEFSGPAAASSSSVNARVSGPGWAMRPDLFPVYDKMYERSELFEELTGAELLAALREAVYKFKRYQYLSKSWSVPV